MRAGTTKVGVIGLSAGMKGYTIGDPVSAARYYLPLLLSRCDLVVAMTDLPREAVSDLAQVKGLSMWFSIGLLARPSVYLWARSSSCTWGAVLRASICPTRPEQ